MSAATYLKKYIKDETGNKTGVIIAAVSETDGILRVGWSITNSNHKDVYDDRLAHIIANGRINKQSNVIVPIRLQLEVITMASRASAYFRINPVIISGIMVD